MKRLLILLTFALLPLAGFGDEPTTVETAPTGMVTISSKGLDVRAVIHDLFQQAEKNYVLQNVPRADLFLSLTGVDFDEALQIVCSVARIDFEIQNGVYYFNKRTDVATPPGTNPQPVKPRGKLSATVLEKRITTRFTKTDLRQIIANIGKQVGVTITVDSDVPKYQLNAFLVNTSLKYGLDLITKATNLEYKFTDEMSIRISKSDPNKVSIVAGNS